MNDLLLEIEKCLESGIPTNDLVQLAANASLIGENSDLENLSKLMAEEYLAPIAIASFPGWGKRGIEKLVEYAFDHNQKLKTNTRAMECAICISQGVIPSSDDIKYLPKPWDEYRKYSIGEDDSNFCLFNLRDRLLRTFDDDYEKGSFLLLLAAKSMQYFADEQNTRSQVDYLLSLILDNRLSLSSSTISKLQKAIDDAPEKEEQLQKLLTEHPVLLDPFVIELFSKQQMGNDFITDFVIRRTNNQYVLVEIENSTDKLFNKNGSFSSALMEAVAQVRDFQAWVSDNLSYVQKKLPEIKHPEGLVVIGRSTELSEIERKRLTEENHSRRGHIKIVTYDDLLAISTSVHKNIIERPIVRKSKETKCI
ncbi:DUF4263 domain-containing protein [bacterium]|nr:DUF4263 domain-containing protein [bacterium]